ncbi:MAG: DUF6768 family protein [Brevundimonas sp.]
MKDIDRMIEEALDGEEQALFRETAQEPGFFGQAFGLLGGPTGWVSAVMIVVQSAMFVVGVWTGWRFFQAETALSALHWGLPSIVLLLTGTAMKMALMPTMQANRVLRELKRLELQVAMARKA